MRRTVRLLKRGPRPQPTSYDRMPQFGAQHLTMGGVAVTACGMYVLAARRVAGTPRGRWLRQMVGWVLGVTGAAWAVYCLQPKFFDARESLPLHLCDVLRPIMAFGLVTGNETALAASYYWGIVFNPQAMLTPDLSYFVEPRWLRFATYWFFHIVALAVPLGQLAAGYRPTWKGFRRASAMAAGYVPFAMTVNHFTKGNYGFLSHAPAGRSIIDILPPWPWYIACEALGALGVFALMTLPFNRD